MERGIIIADTKFEFGLDEDGYEPEHSQPSLDKQLARDWLKENKGHNMTLPQDIVDRIINIYSEVYETLTGEKL